MSITSSISSASGLMKAVYISLAIAAVIVVFYIAYALIGFLKDPLGTGAANDDEKKKQKEAEKKIKEELNEIPTFDGSKKPTITETQAAGIAEQLYSIMNKNGQAEDHAGDSSAIYNMCKSLNGKDLQLVYAKFGVRDRTNVTWANPVTSWAGTPLDLFGWFVAETRTASNLAGLYNNVWYKSGLKPFAPVWPATQSFINKYSKK
jgi:hypothetical protein